MLLQSCFFLVFCETQQGILASMTASSHHSLLLMFYPHKERKYSKYTSPVIFYEINKHNTDLEQHKGDDILILVNLSLYSVSLIQQQHLKQTFHTRAP